MPAAIWITKLVVSFFTLVVLDKGWSMLKTAVSNRKSIKPAA